METSNSHASHFTSGYGEPTFELMPIPSQQQQSQNRSSPHNHSHYSSQLLLPAWPAQAQLQLPSFIGLSGALPEPSAVTTTHASRPHPAQPPVSPQAAAAAKKMTSKRRGPYSKTKCQRCRKDKKKVIPLFLAFCPLLMPVVVILTAFSASLEIAPARSNVIAAKKRGSSVPPALRPRRGNKRITLHFSKITYLRQVRLSKTGIVHMCHLNAGTVTYSTLVWPFWIGYIYFCV